MGDIRGRGLFWTVEIVEDKSTKKPFAAQQKIAPQIQKAALELGLMCYPAQGCADGKNGDHVLLAPSYTSTKEEIETIISILSRAVGLVLNRIS